MSSEDYTIVTGSRPVIIGEAMEVHHFPGCLFAIMLITFFHHLFRYQYSHSLRNHMISYPLIIKSVAIAQDLDFDSQSMTEIVGMPTNTLKDHENNFDLQLIYLLSKLFKSSK